MYHLLRHQLFHLEVVEEKGSDTISGSCLGSGRVTETEVCAIILAK
jgi:hypothetical protein